MKRRMISMLLVLIMVFSFVATLDVTAFADNTLVITDYATLVTISKGQTLIGICSSLSVNYADVKNGILVANNFSSETQLNKLTVGEKVWIPTSKSNSAAIVKNAYAFDENGKATGRSTGGGVATPTVNIPTEYVTTYTIKSGDTIGKICKAYNLDYDQVKEAIVKLNPTRFTSVASLSKIQPSWTIYIPTSNANAVAAAKLITTAETEISSSGTTTTTTTGDKLWGYVVKHQMASGETIKSVCNALGKSYSTEISEMVKALNGITNLNSVKAGTTYWFPSTYASGTCYAVYSHTVVSGDTMGNLTTARGLTYSTVQGLLQGLNPNVNLNSIKRGSTVLVLGKASGTSTSSSGVKVVIGGNSHTITKADTTNGTFTVSASTALSGSSVTVTATPNSGYGIASIDVVGKTSGNVEASSNASPFTFTMPDQDVTVKVTFSTSSAQFNILRDYKEAEGTITCLVGGTAVDKANAGATVVVQADPASGKALDKVTYTYNLNGKAYSYTMSGNSFTMPAANVTVHATFTTGTVLTFEQPSNGTITVKKNGTEVASGVSVKASDTITVSAAANGGYTVTGSSCTVTGSSVTQSGSNGSWTITGIGANAKIVVSLPAVTTYYLYKSITGNGTVSFTSDGESVDRAAANASVTVNATPDSGWGISKIEAGSTTAENKTSATFTMPASDTTAKITFLQMKKVILPTTLDHYTIDKVEVNGVDVTDKVNAGTVVAIKGDTVKVYLTFEEDFQYNTASASTCDGSTISGDTYSSGVWSYKMERNGDLKLNITSK